MKAIIASLMLVSVAAFANPPATTDTHATTTTTTTTKETTKKDAKAATVDCTDKKNATKTECKTTK